MSLNESATRAARNEAYLQGWEEGKAYREGRGPVNTPLAARLRGTDLWPYYEAGWVARPQFRNAEPAGLRQVDAAA